MAAKTAANMNRFFRRLLRTLLAIFLLLNVMAFFHAWKFTHFTAPAGKNERPSRGFQLSAGQKIKTALFGISNPKPQNRALPAPAFETVKIESTETLEGWFVPAPPGGQAAGTRPTVALFHGYRGEKSTMLDRCDELHRMGHPTLLVDFSGSGGSGGLTTTIGHDEAEQVREVYRFLQEKGVEDIVLFGTSMGAAAVLRALHEYPEVQPVAVVLECPFGTMYGAVAKRFELLGVPAFPLAGLLTFWGGVQNGFWAFGHNPVDYAASVSAPTLLLWGEADDRVGRSETEAIFANLAGEKTLHTYPRSGHESYLYDHAEEWRNDVRLFFSQL